MEVIKREKHIIDADGKTLGKLAVEISILLMGKHKPNFEYYQDKGDFVVVKNPSKFRLTGRKMEQKKYYHHTGYLGGLKAVSVRKVFEKNPSEVIKKAVYGMLPKNKLRAQQIKRLKFE
jgi:large subunit ribosomal protein L13